jgi:hypothetical protein
MLMNSILSFLSPNPELQTLNQEIHWIEGIAMHVFYQGLRIHPNFTTDIERSREQRKDNVLLLRFMISDRENPITIDMTGAKRSKCQPYYIHTCHSLRILLSFHKRQPFKSPSAYLPVHTLVFP